MRIRAKNNEPSRIRCALVATILVSMGALTATAQAAEFGERSYQIEAQSVSSALRAFAAQTNLPLVFDEGDVGQARTEGVSGTLEPRAALTRILQGTGLEFEVTSNNVIVVRKQEIGTSRATEQSFLLEEVVVTAEKRVDLLQNVPLPVTAVTAERLVNNNQLRLQDFYTSVPGLSVSPTSSAAQILSIRGVTTGSGNPTVGITVDDVPFGGSTQGGIGSFVPDFDPSDLARIEVLRGPQGTLYGASSMGGLLKFVTVEPNTDAVSGRVQVGVSGISHGNGAGYNARGAVNIPLSDSAAMRASAFTRQDPGYIDNPVLGIHGLNEERVSGGRLSGVWRPVDNVALKLSALYQEREADGSSDINVLPGLGDLQQNYIRNVGASESKVQAYSATLEAQLRDMTLTSISGYNINSFEDSLDFTAGFGAAAQAFYDVGGAALPEDGKNTKFTQEVRLAGGTDSKLGWLVGAFYTDERFHIDQSVLATEPTSGERFEPALITVNGSGTYEEYAAFANLDYHITERFDVQFGARQSRINLVSLPGLLTGALLGGAVSISAREESTQDAFTYLLTPRFIVSPSLMLYARMASGYRAGGANSLASGGPRQYDPDKTKNYEIGVKGSLFERVLSYEASLYYIDWDGIQLSLINPDTSLGYTANAGHAKSQGIELSQTLRPMSGLTISAWVTWNEAVLKEGFPAGSLAMADAGDRLPNTSRFSGNLSIDQEFPIASAATGFVGASASYAGQRWDLFNATDERTRFPAYTRVDLRAGAKLDGWTANLYVTNLTDERGMLANALTNLPFAYQYIRPRTFGMSIARAF
ncbi:TonB-dependent receptor domain-containing protein [Steroidobacter sp.]|uniref:TonB-dependent receptor domain-containing protein n=1 Tax=Steroidobacter sp. TaxID=1978227 RepID=UPI001A43F967|nr:TonB-dependent receptor [Steroidobacter sp.]MBL8269054.1 TonB-dependent receptor [Steroidobacter sp.]